MSSSTLLAMPSVVLVSPDGDEVTVEDRPTFIQLVYGDGWRPKVGGINAAYRALVTGEDVEEDPGRPVSMHELQEALGALGTTAATPDTVARRSGNGGIAFGRVDLTDAPSSPEHGTRKDYVDSRIRAMTQAAYDALPIKDPGVLYVIVPG